MSEKIQMHKDAEAVSKLVKEPVEVEVGIYGLNDEGDGLIEKGSVKAFLHRLNWLERNQIRTCSAQAYKFFIENSEEKEVANLAVGAIISRMTVYFSLRRDSKPGSEKFFPSKESIMEYPMEQGIMEIHARYNNEFALSEKEWGNLLRARSLETSSDLPVKLEEPRSEALSQS